MADITDYAWLLEKIDTESPGDLTVAPGATEATLFFIVDTKQIYKTFITILGYTVVSSAGGNIQPTLGFDRQIPMSHPRYPYLYADKIEIVGVGVNGKIEASNLTYPDTIFNTSGQNPVDYKTFPFQEYYATLRISVRFTSRNYFLLTNDQLSKVILNDKAKANLYVYYKRDVRNQKGVKPSSYYDLREYLRYTEITIKPGNELIANSTGKGFWKSQAQGGAPAQAPKPESVITIENASTNFQNITKNEVRIKWYQIPKWLFLPLENDNWRPWDYAGGMVNYGPNFDDDGGNVDLWNYLFFNFAPGTLLYMGYELEEASNGFPMIIMKSTFEDMPYNNLYNQYYNVTFKFSQFVIPEDQRVQPELKNINNLLGKMYTNGWNYVPNPNRNFYYIENGRTDPVKLTFPPYWSFPFQDLFNPRDIVDA